MKRYLSLLAALLIALLMITGCQDNSIPDETQAPETSAPETTAAPVQDMVIVKDGTVNYTVVRGEGANQNTIDAAALLVKRISEYTGAQAKLTTDWVKNGEEHDHDSLEILVGQTGYRESREALEGIPYGNYVIKQVGRKLVVNAWSDSALDRAMTDLFKTIKRTAAEGNLTLPGDLYATDTVTNLINNLPVYAGGDAPFILHTGTQNYLVQIPNTDAETYAAYADALEERGYTCYTRREVNGSQFSTYTSQTFVVNTAFSAHNSEVRLVIQPTAPLPARESDVTEQDLVTPKFAMIGLEYDYNNTVLQNFLSLIWQLSDGSYIIVDGGVDRNYDAKALYDFMYENAPDKDNIVISAWIITHAHEDHYGGFINFCSGSYISKVTIKQVIANLPGEEALTMFSESTSGTPATLINLAKRHSEAGYVKAHVGQIFHFSGASVDILYTYECLIPDALDDTNSYSLILAIEVGGQRFLITGDATNKACTVAYKMFGDTLQSDFLQLTHHGINVGSKTHTGVVQLYTRAKAPVILWPAGGVAYEAYRTRPFNAHAVNLKTTKEIFVSGKEVITFALPYTVGTSGFDSILK